MFSGKSLVLLALVAGLMSMSWAQEPQPVQQQDRPPMAQSITGCLAKGSSSGEFVLTEEKNGDKITVKGSADLDKHSANHKVKLTGVQTTEENKPVFKVTSIEHISDTCTPTR